MRSVRKAITGNTIATINVVSSIGTFLVEVVVCTINDGDSQYEPVNWYFEYDGHSQDGSLLIVTQKPLLTHNL